MWYEVLKIIVLVLGPVLIYSALRITFQVPELITALPTAGRRIIEAVGALFIVGAWFVAYVEPFSGAMALIGLVLLATPFAADKLSQSKTAYLDA
jgi:hypothetical protein